MVPRNLHFIRISRLFSCQRSVNLTLGSSELKMSVKMGIYIRAWVTREGLIGIGKGELNLEKRCSEEI